MSDKTKIEWTDATWNPIRGCSRVSEGCRNCYAETVANRFSGEGQPYEGLIAKGGQWNGSIKVVDHVMDQPLRWRKPRRIFVNSISDMFHDAVPDSVIDEVFSVMAAAYRHTFQVLTKRPDRMLAYANRVAASKPHDPVNSAVFDLVNATNGGFAAWPLSNVWLGVSIEDQTTADERVPLLLQTPAAVRFVSAEPLLGPVDLAWLPGSEKTDSFGNRHREALNGFSGIDWVIVGGESGPNARPMHPQWVRNLRNRCRMAGVPFFFKQWGEWEIASTENGHHDCYMVTNAAYWLDTDGTLVKPSSEGLSDDAHAMVKVGKKKAGRTLDGCTHNEFPGVQP